jgi:ADP-ribose pyrophosphatase YjhB (NUDIX family)
MSIMTSFGVNIAIIKEEKVLLTKRADFPVWCLPGGSIDSGETIAQAAIREAYEETGFEVKLTCLVGLYSRPNWVLEGSHGVLFTAEIMGGNLIKETQETIDAGFFSLSELPVELIWWHLQRIRDAFSGEIGFVRLQDARWPYGEKSRFEIEALVKSGQIPVQKVIDEICGVVGSKHEVLELNPLCAR